MLLLLMALYAADNTFALGVKEETAEKPQKVEVSGKVRMVGNSPMTSLIISGEEREWYVEQEEMKKLVEYQQQIVTVKAQEYYYDRTFANGSSAGRQYYLKNIVVIKPKR